ncbi:NYN domain-containing protein [Candidatus Woesearchaeota archaeon]|nr:NYN domain-containing protein [Candidatus Woesearchaeota archaeon]
MKPVQHKEQKVLVLFDVQNMYYSAKQLYQSKVNFKEILNTAVAGRKLARAIAYVIKTDIKEESHFHEALENIGIEVKAKDLQTFYGGAKKGDWDIGIAMDAVRLSSKVDTVVLVSGDGDFKELLLYLKAHGCRTEVVAFGKTTSSLLKTEADLFTNLEENKHKYLLKRRITVKVYPKKGEERKEIEKK